MTDGVPYSFVPGTKAKADQVNANFIDVLSKIDDTNIRIDEAEEHLDDTDTQLSQKADIDLSNISAEGQKLFDAKADSSLLDGKWTVKSSTLASSVSIGLNGTKTYSLSSYLPSDSNRYEVRCSVWITGGTSAGHACQINLSSDAMSAYTAVTYCVTRANAAYYDSNNALMIVGTGRKIQVIRTSFGSGSCEFSLQVNAYRKVR